MWNYPSLIVAAVGNQEGKAGILSIPHGTGKLPTPVG